MLRNFFPVFFNCLFFLSFFVSCAKKEVNRSKASVNSSSNLMKEAKGGMERKSLSIDDYLSWFSKNKSSLVVSIDTLGFIYTCEFRPSEIDALSSGAQGAELDSLLLLKGDYSFFYLDVQAKDHSKGEKMRAISKTSYSSFDIQKDFRLSINNDTIPSSLFIPIRESVVISGHLVYQLGFEHKIARSKDLYGASILFDDKLLGAGKLRFKFEKGVFGHLPTLKTPVKNKG